MWVEYLEDNFTLFVILTILIQKLNSGMTNITVRVSVVKTEMPSFLGTSALSSTNIFSSAINADEQFMTLHSNLVKYQYI